MKFSEREGITKPKVIMQINTVDNDLRNSLWNMIYTCYLEKNCYPACLSDQLYNFLKFLWISHFKKPADVIDKCDYQETITALRNHFLKNGEWYEVYNIVEFFANNFPDENKNLNARFIQVCNKILELELSGYRFVGKLISPISSKAEIAEVESAMMSPLKAVNTHLENALRLLSDKELPDYRNSIKESISSVEAICKIISKDPNASLGQALNAIEKGGILTIHPELKKAFSSLYHYTSDADGIRHALKDDKINANFEEAKFMLIACSAFVNYLISKSAKASIEIN